MPIYIGNQKINISGVSKVYVGSQLVYQPGVVELDYIVLTNPTTSLNRGSAFSFGGTVTAYYTDGTSADVTANTTFSGYNMATAGTYTVTASYTEDGITKTATYSLTVNKIWTQIWSGSKTITTSGKTTTGTSNNFVSSASGTGNAPRIRVTFSTLSGSASNPSVIKYFKNTTATSGNTSTKPTSPMDVTLNSGATVYVLGVHAQTTYEGTCYVYLVKTNNSTTNCKFSLKGTYSGTPGNNSATMTITKIEQYY